MQVKDNTDVDHLAVEEAQLVQDKQSLGELVRKRCLVALAMLSLFVVGAVL